MPTKTERGVLVVYTGGTIGSRPSQPEDAESPQIVVPWSDLLAATPELQEVQRFFPVDCYEGIEALDSCNVGPAHWEQMARAIADNYDKYNGFVVLHGTDTMVYSATALSFMLRNLGKPVIFTGAQRSAMVSYRNDATQNVLTALEFANPQASGLPTIAEVCIYFGGLLLRGNRSVKFDTSGYTAYQSPNVEPLAVAGDSIVVNERAIRRPDPNATFTLRHRIDTHVLPIFISPGIQQTEMAKRQLETPGLKAVVVQAFGSGNIPTTSNFIDLFAEARKKGIVVAAVSQCRRGAVELGIYETSAALLEAGFVAANDLTLEAAQVKLMHLLGTLDITAEDVELEYQRSVAGEQSTSLLLTQYPNSSGFARHSGTSPGRARTRGEAVTMPAQRDQIERALLRLRRAELIGREVNSPDDSDPVSVQIYVDLADDDPLDPHGPSFVGEFRRWPKSDAEKKISGDKGVLVFDVTSYVRTQVKAGDRISFTLAVDAPGASLQWDSVELAVYVRD